MEYLAFARKYRPQAFAQVVGQDDVVGQLTRMIREGRLHHAYVFSGTRGVGKTTMARILAKSLNCLNSDRPTPEPCGECASCRDIQAGRSPDVIEIDGASNTGVDNIRELRESVKFAPSYSRFKIFIIDEVHRISQAAFDALLKTLEEPPPHVKFIFATTELSKVPVTILSRCQKFNFSLVSQDDIVCKLRAIAAEEGIAADDKVLRYVARAALGSIRDAESIFDQISPLLMDGASLESILDMLGEIREFMVIDFIRALVDKNASRALEIVAAVVDEGKDLEKFLDAVIEYTRNVMLARLVKGALDQFVTMPEDIKARIIELASLTPPGLAVKAIDSFIEVKRAGRYLDSLRIPLEVAAIRIIFAQPRAGAEAQRPAAAAPQPVSRPAQPVKPAPTTPAVSQSQPGVQQRASSGVQVGQPQKRPASVAEPKRVPGNPGTGMAGVFDAFKQKEQPAAEKKASRAPSQDEVTGVWERVVKEISQARISLATSLRLARVFGVKGNTIVLGFPRNAQFQKSSAERPANQEYICGVFAAALGVPVSLECVVLDEEVPVEDLKIPGQDLVDDVLEAFDGEVI
jgi:DNA polymerase-3 subunit gamma/tau